MKTYIKSFLFIAILIVPSLSFAETIPPSSGGTSTTGAVSCLSLTYSLSPGSRDIYTNGEVSKLQNFLQSKGYLNTTDRGYFGSLTKTAVISFQTANGISPATGYVGSLTRAKIKELTCGTTTTVSIPSTPQSLSGYYNHLCYSKGLNSSEVYLSWSGVPTNDSNGVTYTIKDAANIIYTGKETKYSHSVPENSRHSYSVRANNSAGSSAYSSPLALFVPYSTCSSSTTTPTTTVISPNGGEIWELYSQHEISWTPDPLSLDVEAYLEKISNGSFITIGKIVPVGYGSIIWDGAINTSGNYSTPVGDYYIRLVNKKTNASDRSDKPFQIALFNTVLNVDLKVKSSKGIYSDGPVSVNSRTIQFKWSSVNPEKCTAIAYSTDTAAGPISLNLQGSSGEQQLTLPGDKNAYNLYVRCSSPIYGGTNGEDYLLVNVETKSACYLSSYDYNNNGKLDSADAELLLSYSAIGGSCPSGKVCDVNKSGVFNSTDVTALNGIINGTSACPVEPTPACYYVQYDYDDSGKLDSNDTTLLLSYTGLNFPAGYCPSGKICDVNKNGVFNSTDATALSSLINGDTRWCSVETNPACYYNLYDYNNNGKLDSADSELLRGYLNSSCPTGKICDVNKSGNFNITDIASLNTIIGGDATLCPIEVKPACYVSSYDLDNSGKIDEGDKKVVSDVYLGTRSCPSGKVCDINKDGRVNSGDTVAIAMIIGGDKTWCPVTTSVCYYAPYDIEGGGVLGEGDIAFIQQIILGNKTCPSGKICDINKDGRVDVFDIGEFRNIQTGVTQCPAPTATQTTSYSAQNQAQIASILESVRFILVELSKILQ